MNDPKIASIDAYRLCKGQTIPADVVWEHFANRRPDTVASWVLEYGDEALARAARMPQVLLQVRGWLDRDRSKAELPPLVMNTAGGSINVLTDDKASTYLNDQAFQGLRRHQRASTRLVAAVDESKLTGAARREHQNRINVHSFIAASAQGAQRQLRLLKQNGKKAPQLEGEPVTPGDVLKEEFLDPMKITAYQLCKDTGLSQTQVSEIIKGKRAITDETDAALSKYFGLSRGYWRRMQVSYEQRKKARLGIRKV